MSTDHQKVWGAGYHAGLEAAESTQEEGAGLLSIKSVGFFWNPGSDQAAVFPLPDRDGRSRDPIRYRRWVTAHPDRSTQQNTQVLLADALVAIVRDGCDPNAVHRALLGVREYCDALPKDALVAAHYQGTWLIKCRPWMLAKPGIVNV